MNINLLEIEKLETRYRANLINSIGGFKSLVLIGTKSEDGLTNLATFSSLFHIGANPALCGLIVRPATHGKNTLGNILATKQYTVNHVLPSFYQQAHQCSAKYAEGVSEFEKVGLNEEYASGVYAPFVKQSIIKFACEIQQLIDIELNNTTLIIGQIISIILPSTILGDDGFLAIEQAQTVTCSGLDSYHTTQQLARLSYAKTDKPLEIIG